jgi:hypothetical protein
MVVAFSLVAVRGMAKLSDKVLQDSGDGGGAVHHVMEPSCSGNQELRARFDPDGFGRGCEPSCIAGRELRARLTQMTLAEDVTLAPWLQVGALMPVDVDRWAPWWCMHR